MGYLLNLLLTLSLLVKMEKIILKQREGTSTILSYVQNITVPGLAKTQ